VIWDIAFDYFTVLDIAHLKVGSTPSALFKISTQEKIVIVDTSRSMDEKGLRWV
jgi:hypothetical protein